MTTQPSCWVDEIVAKRTNMLTIAIAKRNRAEALVLMMPPTAFIDAKRPVIADAAKATATDIAAMKRASYYRLPRLGFWGIVQH